MVLNQKPEDQCFRQPLPILRVVSKREHRQLANQLLLFQLQLNRIFVHSTKDLLKSSASIARSAFAPTVRCSVFTSPTTSEWNKTCSTR